MFCPYIMRTYTRAIIIDTNENGDEVGSILSESYQHEECKKEECGAWYEGRCNFNRK